MLGESDAPQVNVGPVPVMAWESSELSDAGGRVIWWGRVDGRYQVEVHGDPDFVHRGHLHIWDWQNGMVHVHSVPVVLSYGAKFGPDVADIVGWKRTAMTYSDRHGTT